MVKIVGFIFNGTGVSVEVYVGGTGVKAEVDVAVDSDVAQEAVITDMSARRAILFMLTVLSFKRMKLGKMALWLC